MNRIQLDYAVKRLESAANQKYAEVAARFPAIKTGITAAAIRDAIKSGKVKLKSDDDRTVGRYDDLSDIFDITPLEPSEKTIKASKERDGKIKAAQVIVTEEFHRIKDELILGDGSKALKLIEAFAAKKF